MKLRRLRSCLFLLLAIFAWQTQAADDDDDDSPPLLQATIRCAEGRLWIECAVGASVEYAIEATDSFEQPFDTIASGVAPADGLVVFEDEEAGEFTSRIYRIITMGTEPPDPDPPPAGTQTITLQWDPSPETTVAGYRIFYGTTSGEYSAALDVGKTTTVELQIPNDQQTWFFAVTAYTATFLESDPSNEATVTPP